MKILIKTVNVFLKIGLAVVYVLIVLPYRFSYKVFSKDKCRLTIDKSLDSYWEEK